MEPRILIEAWRGRNFSGLEAQETLHRAAVGSAGERSRSASTLHESASRSLSPAEPQARAVTIQHRYLTPRHPPLHRAAGGSFSGYASCNVKVTGNDGFILPCSDKVLRGLTARGEMLHLSPSNPLIGYKQLRFDDGIHIGRIRLPAGRSLAPPRVT